MCCPTTVTNFIEKVNCVIQRLHDERLAYYETVSQKYHDMKAMYNYFTGKSQNHITPLGFEAFISADMRQTLAEKFNPAAVFMEFPGIGQDKIDIYVETNDACAYIENKMYYSPGNDGKKNPYRHDFKKIRSLLDIECHNEKVAVGVLVHLQLYKNRNYPAHKLYETFKKKELDSTEWWSDIRYTGDKANKHFVYLLFGKK